MPNAMPNTPPRWGRNSTGDVGREIGRWILAEIRQALLAAGIDNNRIDGNHIVGVVPTGAAKIAVYLAGVLEGTRSNLNFSSASDFTVADNSGSDRVDVDLANTAVTPGTYGDGTHVSQITVDAKGRATAVANVLITGAAPTGAAGGDLAGTYPNPTLRTNLKEFSINFQLGDGTNAVATTERVQTIAVDFDCTIQSNTLLADASGSIQLDIKKCSYAGYPGSLASIVASAPPALSSAQKSQDTTLTGWTTAITAGDILQVSVTSASTVKAVTLDLKVIKT